MRPILIIGTHKVSAHLVMFGAFAEREVDKMVTSLYGTVS